MSSLPQNQTAFKYIYSVKENIFLPPICEKANSNLPLFCEAPSKVRYSGWVCMYDGSTFKYGDNCERPGPECTEGAEMIK